jgi:hypothetical protein
LISRRELLGEEEDSRVLLYEDERHFKEAGS